METLSKVFEDKYNKNVKDCTNEEIYHGLLSWTKEQLKGRGYQEGKKKIYYISAEFLIGKLLSCFWMSQHCIKQEIIHQTQFFQFSSLHPHSPFL